MLGFAGTESIGVLIEQLFVDRRQNTRQRRLKQFVLYRRYSQRTLLAILFRDVSPSDRRGAIAPAFKSRQ